MIREQSREPTLGPSDFVPKLALCKTGQALGTSNRIHRSQGAGRHYPGSKTSDRTSDCCPLTRYGFPDGRIISSAVSTVLRSQEFRFADAAGAEHCGYGDLH